MSQPEKQLFKSIEYAESRKNAVFMSICVHFVILIVGIVIPLLWFDPLNLRRYSSVTLAPPPIHKDVLEVTQYKPIPVPRPKPTEPMVEPPPHALVIRPEVKLPEPVPTPKPKPEEFKLPAVKVEPTPLWLRKPNTRMHGLNLRRK